VPTGKLYNSLNNELIANINYDFKETDEYQWWGELTTIEYKQVKDGSGYLIELEDGKKSRCVLKKRVNRAVTSLPPHYVFHFSGSGKFE
jgi:hypothetical protein